MTGCNLTLGIRSSMKYKKHNQSTRPIPPSLHHHHCIVVQQFVLNAAVLASFGAEAAENRNDAAPCAQNAKPIFPPFPRAGLASAARPGPAQHSLVRPERQKKQAAYVTPPWGNPPGLSGLDPLRCAAGGRRGFRAPSTTKQRAFLRSEWRPDV